MANPSPEGHPRIIINDRYSIPIDLFPWMSEDLEAADHLQTAVTNDGSTHGSIPDLMSRHNDLDSDTNSEFSADGVFTGDYQQITSFAGVGAHHHNGTAKRAIRTIMQLTQTMMLHAAIHWPEVEVLDANRWPMAIMHAAFLHNHLPNPESGLSPFDIFT